MKKKTRRIVQAGLIAGIYLLLSLLQQLLLPGSGSMAIQFRLAECLTVLAFFTPAAIPGLAVGCVLADLFTLGALPLDPLFGTAATVLAAGGMYGMRRIRPGNLPLPGLLLPAVCNGLLIGWELTVYVGGAFLLNAGSVALGEVAVTFTCGLALYLGIRGRGLEDRMV